MGDRVVKGLVKAKEWSEGDGGWGGEGVGIGDGMVAGIGADGGPEMDGSNGRASRGDGDADDEGVRDGDKMPVDMEGGCKEILDDEECTEVGQGENGIVRAEEKRKTGGWRYMRADFD